MSRLGINKLTSHHSSTINAQDLCKKVNSPKSIPDCAKTRAAGPSATNLSTTSLKLKPRMETQVDKCQSTSICSMKSFCPRQHSPVQVQTDMTLPMSNQVPMSQSQSQLQTHPPPRNLGGQAAPACPVCGCKVSSLDVSNGNAICDTCNAKIQDALDCFRQDEAQRPQEQQFKADAAPFNILVLQDSENNALTNQLTKVLSCCCSNSSSNHPELQAANCSTEQYPYSNELPCNCNCYQPSQAMPPVQFARSPPTPTVQFVWDSAVPLAQSARGSAIPPVQSARGSAVPLAQSARGSAMPSSQFARSSAMPSSQFARSSAIPLAQSASDSAMPMAQSARGSAMPSTQASRSSPMPFDFVRDCPNCYRCCPAYNKNSIVSTETMGNTGAAADGTDNTCTCNCLACKNGVESKGKLIMLIAEALELFLNSQRLAQQSMVEECKGKHEKKSKKKGKKGPHAADVDEDVPANHKRGHKAANSNSSFASRAKKPFGQSKYQAGHQADNQPGKQFGSQHVNQPGKQRSKQRFNHADKQLDTESSKQFSKLSSNYSFANRCRQVDQAVVCKQAACCNAFNRPACKTAGNGCCPRTYAGSYWRCTAGNNDCGYVKKFDYNGGGDYTKESRMKGSQGKSSCSYGLQPVAHYRPGTVQFPASYIVKRNGEYVRRSLVRTAAGVTLHERAFDEDQHAPSPRSSSKLQALHK